MNTLSYDICLQVSLSTCLSASPVWAAQSLKLSIKLGDFYRGTHWYSYLNGTCLSFVQ